MSLLSRLAVGAARAYGSLSVSNRVSADYLVVAGGAGGGGALGGLYAAGGGGGAGGYQTSTFTLSTLNTYTVTVGAGGTSGTHTVDGGNGGNSVISGTGLTTVTSVGGGGGAFNGSGGSPRNGQNGGSGGGSSGAGGTGGTATSGQGNNGGSVTTNTGGGPGGGGAGAAGTSLGSTTSGGAGGNGLSSSISGSSVTYAGGGGGGGYGGGSAASGGTGGGGAGGASTSNGTAGTANTGGGGGSGGGTPTGGSTAGGAGGSGIVIIAYTSATPKFVGGTLTTSGGKQIHTFTSSGTLSPITPITASYLVVAGGGGSARQLGGYAGNGGGGAGGLLSGSTTIYSGATYVVTVGAGGAGGTTSGVAPSGSNSVLSGTGLTTVTSTGGGGGGGSTGTGANGGSGGGGSGESPRTAGTGTSGQGNNGGAGVNGGGGGGGAGAAGSVAVTITGGAGGVGTSSNISGTSTFYAGGGGGGGYGASGAAGAGGNGGGGNGGTNAGTALGGSGTTNTGGGAGGTAGDPLGATNGASGGSGIVIISYAGSQVFNGGLVTTSGGNTIHTFTSTGALTPLTNNVNNSLRFRSSASAYLNRTPTVAGNRKTFTFSAWVKRGALNGGGTDMCLFNAGTTSPTYDGFRIKSDTISFYQGGAVSVNIESTPVFRDVSAWYHFVLAVDTTQATASNRVKIYVNGNQITAFGTANYPSQNAEASINNTLVHNIAAQYANTSSSAFFDGYMADINFIDGQALEPYYFGNNDANGVWKPILYKGTYGTNGFYLQFNQGLSNSYAASFNGSTQYLTVADNAALEFGSSDFCIEAWVNYTSLTGSNYLLSKVADATSATAAWLIYKNSNTGSINFYASSNGSSYDILGNANIGTLTAGTWNHIAVYRSGNTFYGALNGVVTVLGTSSSSIFNNTSAVGIGAAANGGGKLASSISNFRIVTGSAVYGAATFTPPTSALTAITGTQLLTLQNATIIDNSTNAFTITNNGTTTTSVSYPYSTVGIGADSSPNFNNWTSNNISLTAGTTYDAMIDSPTNASSGTQPVGNYAVLNPLDNNSMTLSAANLDAVGSTTYGAVRSTMAVSSGKYYFEVNVLQNVSGNYVGIAPITSVFNTTNIYPNALAIDNSTIGGIKTVGVTIDFDNLECKFYVNNVLSSTQTIVAANAPYAPFVADGSTGNNASYSVNFGQRPFAYTPPTGYQALCTTNLTTPTILQGNKYMDATLYTGNGSTQTITNAGAFKPDFVWLKSRSNAYHHYLVDSVRGISNYLRSSSTNAEATNNGLTSLNSNGFSLNSATDTEAINQNAATYVGWQWQAGQGSTSSNTQGSITSTVSVNTTAGFSVVTFTSPSSGSCTVGHGIGVAPKMIITKVRNIVNSWLTYHVSLGAGNYIALNTTAASVASSTLWNNTSPTSSVFSIGADFSGGYPIVAYCFAEIAGFSKFGSFTANNSSDGNFIYLGFRPRWIMCKQTSGAGGAWFILDTARNTFNVMNNILDANSSGAERNDNIWDATANGMKLRIALSGDFIYMAFAEHPFKNSNAR